MPDDDPPALDALFGPEATASASLRPGEIPSQLTDRAAPSSQNPPPLRRVWLRNFKSFEDFTVHLGDFNVLAGANNAGKSTVLQGIDLLFTLLKIHQESGGDRLATTGRYVPLSALPVAALRDLFYLQRMRRANQSVFATVGAQFSDDSTIEFGVRAFFGNANSTVLQNAGIEGDRLRSLLAFPAIWVPSSVGVVRDEEYRQYARRAALISAGRHNEVLRNLLHEMSLDRPERLEL